MVSAFAELLRPGATLQDARAEFSLGYLFLRVNDGKIMAEHLDRYEEWLKAKGLSHSSVTFKRWVSEGFQPGVPNREQWRDDPYPLIVIRRSREKPQPNHSPPAPCRAPSQENSKSRRASRCDVFTPPRRNLGKPATGDPRLTPDTGQRKTDKMTTSHDIAIRVRYAETDRMGLLHHANYLVYFEMARTELLRQRGISYREIEDAGHLLVIVDLGCKFKRPAHYDDLLTRPDHGRAGHARQDRAPLRSLPRRRSPGRGALDAGLRRPRRQATGPAGSVEVVRLQCGGIGIQTESGTMSQIYKSPLEHGGHGCLRLLASRIPWKILPSGLIRKVAGIAGPYAETMGVFGPAPLKRPQFERLDRVGSIRWPIVEANADEHESRVLGVLVLDGQ